MSEQKPKREPGYYHVKTKKGIWTIAEWIVDEGLPFWSQPNATFGAFDKDLVEIDETRIVRPSESQAENSQLKARIAELEEALAIKYKKEFTDFDDHQ